MTTFTTQTYNMFLQSLLFSITPALPGNPPIARLPVGVPETIPNDTFITRALTPADGVPLPEITRMNPYIAQAVSYHDLYGLTTVTIDSLEDILKHFENVTTTIERIRIVSHGNDAFLYVPMFENGSWGVGVPEGALSAFRLSDEAGMRYLVSGTSDMIIDGLSTIVDGLRTINNGAALAPFGIQASGNPAAGDMTLFFRVVNDHFQVAKGTVVEESDQIPPTFTLISGPQRAALTIALDHIEGIIRGRLVGTTVGSTQLTADHLNELKTVVTTATPTQLGFLGPDVNLGSAVLTNLATAMGAAPRTEAALRTALVGNTNEPMFHDSLWGIIEGLRFFNNSVLTLGATTVTGVGDIFAAPHLESYFLICSDLFVLEHGSVSINGNAITPSQKTALKNGLRAIADIIAARVTAPPNPSGIAAVELTDLRVAIEGLSTRQSAITGGWKTYFAPEFPNMQPAVTSLGSGFRTKLNHLRSIMRSSSHVDIRGCMVGATRSYLTAMRAFLGTGANLPTVTAPDWNQSFPAFDQFGGWGTPASNDIDPIVGGGLGPDISAADVGSSFTTWKGLIDFDPHFTFIRNLFDAAASQFDFATLEWLHWKTAAVATGIPVLRMEAERIDDIVGLDLGDIIQRFSVIFEVNAPNQNVRDALTALRPHVATFKPIRTAVRLPATPTPAELPGLFAQLTNLAGPLGGIANFPVPASPLAPASASLADLRTSVTNIQAHIDFLLATHVAPFFTAVQGRLGHVNREIRYYYNIGLPLLLQSSTRQPVFKVSTFMSATSEAQRDSLVANALRSWMRIQWTGTNALAAAMNAKITGVTIANDAQRTAAAQVSMLSADDPQAIPSPNAVISPMPDYQAHIITEPVPP